MPPSPPLAPSSNSPTAITPTAPPNLLQPAGEVSSHQSPLDSSFTSPKTLRIGTRASALAIAQVEIFTSLLKSLHPTLPTKTIPISVAGDRDKTTNLHTLAQTGKSLWTEELEVLLLKGEIDCIVHSLKDVPTKVVSGCEVKIVGERGERRDCVVFPKRRKSTPEPTTADIHGESTSGHEELNHTEDNDEQPSPKKRKIEPYSASPYPAPPQKLSDLPPNSIVGTSSIRRSAMIRRCYPTLRIQDVRGNVGTRLRKLDDPANGFDCLILAAAGIQRVGMGERVGEWLDPDSGDEAEGAEVGDGGADGEGGGKGVMLHAVGQGAIGLEIREGDEWVGGLLEGREGREGVVINRVSWECQAERSLLRTLEGGCSVPVGVSCSWEDEVSTSAGENSTNTTETSVDGQDNNATSDAPQPQTSPQMTPGTLKIRASVTSVDGTQCVAARHRQWVSNDQEADEAGWEVARVLVERGAGRILEGINLNRGMVERGDGA
ncbi:MAG: hypothetical protein Q9209_003547 [Squamulea sp. 1 TL-2023]